MTGPIGMRVVGVIWLVLAAMNLSVVVLAVQQGEDWVRPAGTLGAQACAAAYSFWIAMLLDQRARRWAP